MDGQYIIVKKVSRTKLASSLMSDNDKTHVEIEVVERSNRKNNHKIKIVIANLSNNKHSKDIEFNGHTIPTYRRFSAIIHKNPVKGNFGMITFVLPNHQQVLTLVK